MRKVELNMTQLERYKIIKELVDHGGNKKRASIKLGISLRQINRLIIVYKVRGKEGFIHGNLGRSPKNKLSANLSNTILQLYTTIYKDENEEYAFNFTHFKEMLEERHNIKVSTPTIKALLWKENIISPLAQKATKRKMRKKLLLESKQLEGKANDEIEEMIDHQISIEDAHPRKERCKYFGELIEMDASSLRWFGNTVTHLHLAIDNSTGKIVGGYFDYQETLNGYYNVFYQILTKYGIPLAFLTDRRTVFEYESCKKKDENKDVLTQFGYACKILGTELKCTSVPQAKGMIERANGTLQRRLMQELHLNRILTIDEANKYLAETFIPKFNQKFGIKNTNAKSVFEKSPSKKEIYNILAIISRRTIDSGHSISFNNEHYIPGIDGSKVFFTKNTKCLVIKTFDNRLVLSIDDRLFDMIKIKKVKGYSENFDIDRIDEKLSYKPVKYAPPASHPWKQKSFNNYLKNTKHGVYKQQAGLLC